MHPGAHAQAAPDRPAVLTDTGETVTYAQLEAQANRVSHVLRDAGLQPGDHVAICVENDPIAFSLLWGAHYAGLLYTACSTRLTADELAYIVGDCGASAVILSAAYADKGAALLDTPRRFSVLGAIDGFDSLEDALAAVPDTPLDDRVAGADMLYSSGTTGQPKGIKPRGERPPLETPLIITGPLKQLMGAGPEDVFLSPAPLYHAAPLRFTMAMQQLGGTVLLPRRFDANRTLELIAEHRVTLGQFVPTMFVRLLRLPQERRAAADVSSLRNVIHAGAPCPVEVKRELIEWWGPIVHEYYASTEACGLTWITAADWLEHPGSVGRALIGTPHIVGEDGTELPAGETGGVWFSDGPPFEYHNDPEKTAQAHDERGWATNGDIGFLDADGFLHLTDRKAFMIISGGVNVYPQEAENVLLEHPSVLDAAVFGVPDDDLGERVIGVVQPVDGVAGAAPDLPATLIAHCRAKLADFKCPKAVELRDDLPRHETGKLYKRKLVDEFRAAAA